MKIKKLGPIYEGELNLNKMTVFIGESGSGKTYMSYAIYGIHKHLENEIKKLKLINDEDFNKFLESKELRINIDTIINQLFNDAKKSFKEQEKQILGGTFNSTSEMFEETDIDIDYKDFPELKLKFTEYYFMARLSEFFFKNDEEVYLLREEFKNDEIYISLIPIELGEIPLNQRMIDNKKLLKNSLNKILGNSLMVNKLIYIPAERVGLHVFREELNKGRLDDFAGLSFNSSQSRENGMDREAINIPTYPEPISSYLNNLNQWFYWSNPKFKLHNNSGGFNSISNELLNGKFEINDKQEIFFRERYGKSRYKTQRVPFQISSSTLKSLFGLDLYLRIGFTWGDYLVIDEPELNLHVKSQKILASVLYELMESGIYVILSTHSDYLVRELVNLELKNQLKKNKKEKNISCYYFSDNSINELPPLTDVNYIENFDDSFVSVENEYYKLLNKIEKSKND